MNHLSFNSRQLIKESFKIGLLSGAKTGFWLIKIMLPVSFLILICQWSGLLDWLSVILSPLLRHIGLRGEASLAIISAIIVNPYPAIVMMESMNLTLRESIILAQICLISHAMISESLILKRAGSSIVYITCLRLGCALISCLVLNWILPGQAPIGQAAEFQWQTPRFADLPLLLWPWFARTAFLVARVILVVCSLMVGQQLLRSFGLIDKLTAIFKPVMRCLLLPEAVAFQWLTANALGLSFGSAVLIDSMEKKLLTPDEARLLNTHIAINHSLLEETILFASLGLPVFWLIAPRLILAVLAVLLFRLVSLRKKRL